MKGAPLLLVAGGLDSSGAAGLDADRRSAATFGCEALAVATSKTDQDLFEVRAVEEDLLWGTAAETALDERPVAALKFGLLPGVASIVTAARLVARARHGAPELPAVVDPVLASSSGYSFWGPRELAAVRASLLVAGPILTPNIDEAAELAWKHASELRSDPERRVDAAAALLRAGASAVVLKGGHGDEDPVRDLVLVPGAAPEWIERPRVPGRGIRGSGCRFATALAAGLARGRSLPEAARDAGDHVADLIRASEG